VEIFELSQRIHTACDRIHQATTDMYEAMHPDGEPHADILETEQNIRDFREWVNNEIDLIRELIGEYSGQYKL
jgi:DnaJ-domain-containing protein 1